MIDTGTIEKYILGGEWENQYPQVIEQLLAEVKKLREMVMLLDARLGTIHNHALGGSMEDWEQAQASILAECRGEVPHEIHPYAPLDMKNNR